MLRLVGGVNRAAAANKGDRDTPGMSRNKDAITPRDDLPRPGRRGFFRPASATAGAPPLTFPVDRTGCGVVYYRVNKSF